MCAQSQKTNNRIKWRSRLLAAGIALSLGCSISLPAQAEIIYGVQHDGDRLAADIGPFKLIFLEAGDSYNAYSDGALVLQDLVTSSILDNTVTLEQLKDDALYAYVINPAINYFAQSLGEKKSDNTTPAPGSINYYIGMQPISGAFVASAGYNGSVSDIYQKLVTPGAEQKSSVVYMNFNSSSPIYLADYQRAVSLENGVNPMRFTMHEFTHSLGMVDSVINQHGEYHWSSNINKYSQGLRDILGNPAQANQEIVLVRDGSITPADTTKFYLCTPDAANYKNPTFRGTNTDALTQNQGVEILGALNRTVNGQQEDYLLNGSSLSHVSSLISYMHFGNYGANTMVTELDLALLQDLGYAIERGKYFGDSYLSNGVHSHQGSVSTLTDSSYTQTTAFTGEAERSMVTGAHIYRNDFTLNQNANITVGNAASSSEPTLGEACAGIIISGARNTLNIAEGTTITAHGFAGTGIGVNYGANNTINIAGTVKATGAQSIGLLVSGDCENFYSAASYEASRSTPNLDGPDYEVLNTWKEMAEDNNGTKSVIQAAIADNSGYSIDNLNITGTLAGQWASIYISPYNCIKNINVAGDGHIAGDILFGGRPMWNYAMLLAKDNHYMDTHLNFGLDAAGQVDADYNGSFSGNISFPWNYGEGSDPLDTGCTFIYLDHQGGSLDLNVDKNMDEAAIAVLSISNEENTITNLGGSVYLWSMSYGYPHEQPTKVGTMNIKGTLRPGGTSYADIQILADEYKQGSNGKLQLDFDLNTLEHDRISFIKRTINGNVKDTYVRLGKLEFVEQNPYQGAPTMLTREDFFGYGSSIIFDESKLETSIVTKEEAYGAATGLYALRSTPSSTSSAVTNLSNTWALYSLGSGFEANMPNEGAAKKVADILDQRVANLSNASLNERELFAAFMRDTNTNNWAGYANQLADTAYAEQLGAAMNINHLLSSASRRTVFDQEPFARDAWQLFAQPFAFSNRQQGANSYSQSGNGLLMGANRQFGSTGLSLYGGYLHDNTSLQGLNHLKSKRDGGFVGASFMQAPDSKNGPFVYGFARYDNSHAKNKRQLSFSTYAASNEGDLRQQGGAVELGAGWRQTKAKGTLTLHTGLNYALVEQAGFKENGSSSALSQGATSYRSVMGRAGVQYSTTPAPLNKLADYQLTATAAWNQELHRSKLDYSVELLDNALPLHWQNNEDKGWLELNLQGQLRYKKSLAVTASLGTELFRKNHRGVNGSINLEYKF